MTPEDGDQIRFDQLLERSPYERGVHEDPVGGVVVHRCHPDSDPTDYFAFAHRHETEHGAVSKQVYLYQTAHERANEILVDSWDNAVVCRHVREGSHEDCRFCRGLVEEHEVLNEIGSMIASQLGPESLFERTTIGGQCIVDIDSHVRTKSGDMVDVLNSTRDLQHMFTWYPYARLVFAGELTDADRLRIRLEPVRVDGAEVLV